MGCANADVILEVGQKSDGRWEGGVIHAVKVVVARDEVAAEEKDKEASESSVGVRFVEASCLERWTGEVADWRADWVERPTAGLNLIRYFPTTPEPELDDFRRIVPWACKVWPRDVARVQQPRWRYTTYVSVLYIMMNAGI